MKPKTLIKPFYFVLALLVALGLSGCGNKKTTKESSNYKDTKSMVIDILKTPEGKKAMKGGQGGSTTQGTKSSSSSSSGDGEGDSSSDGSGGSGGDSASGGGSGDSESKSSSGSSGMKAQSQDISKLVKEENKKAMKTMSSDPEFQKAIIAGMKTPEFQNTLRVEMIQMMAQMQQGLMKTQGTQQKSKKGGGGESAGGGGGGGGGKGKMGQ